MVAEQDMDKLLRGLNIKKIIYTKYKIRIMKVIHKH